MVLPTTPASSWFNDFGQPFGLFGNASRTFDDYELYEEDGEFLLTIDMPGFELDEISLAWDDGVLNVAAEHSDDERGFEKTYHRRFRFPKEIDEDAIEASYTNGVLEVVLPLEEGATVFGTDIPIEG